MYVWEFLVTYVVLFVSLCVVCYVFFFSFSSCCDDFLCFLLVRKGVEGVELPRCLYVMSCVSSVYCVLHNH